MRKPIALLLGTLLPLLGLSGIGRAQSSVQVQGIIQSVDCQAQALVLSDAATGASNTVVVEPYTPVLVGSTSIAFCALEQYVGTPASAVLVASGSQLVATRIDVLGPATAAPPPVVAVPQSYPVPEPAPAEVVSPLPIVGIVLGTIIVAGLLYLLTHGHDGRYYRYPYYGGYYHYYYRPEYRAYLGSPPALAPIIAVPPVIAGPVLGTCTVGGLDYLVARDRDGRFYRYPYYGPYRQHYYRAEYRPYWGPYRDAPLREGDLHWQGPLHQNVRIQGPPVRPDPARAPAWQGPPPQWNHDPRNTVPGPQGPPPQWNHDPRNTAPGSQGPPPRWTPPAVQNAPASTTWNGPPPARPDPGRAPAWQGPPPQWNHDPRNTAPGPQGPPPQWNHDPRNTAPGPQGPPPRWTPPAVQNAPASTTRNGPPPGPQWVPNDRHRDAPASTTQRQSCGGQRQNQGCNEPGANH
jgi:hypothetical protein